MARILTVLDRYQCAHGGTVRTTTATALTVDGQPALVSDGTPSLPVTGCTASSPCVTASIDAGFSPLAEHGFRVVLDTSPGTSYGADGRANAPLALDGSEGAGFDGGVVVV